MLSQIQSTPNFIKLYNNPFIRTHIIPSQHFRELCLLLQTDNCRWRNCARFCFSIPLIALVYANCNSFQFLVILLYRTWLAILAETQAKQTKKKFFFQTGPACLNGAQIQKKYANQFKNSTFLCSCPKIG